MKTNIYNTSQYGLIKKKRNRGWGWKMLLLCGVMLRALGSVNAADAVDFTSWNGETSQDGWTMKHPGNYACGGVPLQSYAASNNFHQITSPAYTFEPGKTYKINVTIRTAICNGGNNNNAIVIIGSQIFTISSANSGTDIDFTVPALMTNANIYIRAAADWSTATIIRAEIKIPVASNDPEIYASPAYISTGLNYLLGSANPPFQRIDVMGQFLNTATTVSVSNSNIQIALGDENGPIGSFVTSELTLVNGIGSIWVRLAPSLPMGEYDGDVIFTNTTSGITNSPQTVSVEGMVTKVALCDDRFYLVQKYNISEFNGQDASSPVSLCAIDPCGTIFEFTVKGQHNGGAFTICEGGTGDNDRAFSNPLSFTKPSTLNLEAGDNLGDKYNFQVITAGTTYTYYINASVTPYTLVDTKPTFPSCEEPEILPELAPITCPAGLTSYVGSYSTPATIAISGSNIEAITTGANVDKEVVVSLTGTDFEFCTTAVGGVSRGTSVALTAAAVNAGTAEVYVRLRNDITTTPSPNKNATITATLADDNTVVSSCATLAGIVKPAPTIALTCPGGFNTTYGIEVAQPLTIKGSNIEGATGTFSIALSGADAPYFQICTAETGTCTVVTSVTENEIKGIDGKTVYIRLLSTAPQGSITDATVTVTPASTIPGFTTGYSQTCTLSGAVGAPIPVLNPLACPETSLTSIFGEVSASVEIFVSGSNIVPANGGEVVVSLTGTDFEFCSQDGLTSNGTLISLDAAAVNAGTASVYVRLSGSASVGTNKNATISASITGVVDSDKSCIVYGDVLPFTVSLAGDDTYCVGQYINLTATVTGPEANYTYTFKKGTETIGTANNASNTYAYLVPAGTTGELSFTVEVSDGTVANPVISNPISVSKATSGCPSVSFADITDLFYCPGTAKTLAAVTGWINYTTGDGTQSYQWTRNGVDLNTNNGSYTIPATGDDAIAGTYIITASLNGVVMDSKTYVVTTPATPATPTVSQTNPDCNNRAHVFTVTTNPLPAGVTYEWYDGETSVGTGTTYTLGVEDLNVNYSITVKAVTGCPNISAVSDAIAVTASELGDCCATENIFNITFGTGTGSSSIPDAIAASTCTYCNLITLTSTYEGSNTSGGTNVYVLSTTANPPYSNGVSNPLGSTASEGRYFTTYQNTTGNIFTITPPTLDADSYYELSFYVASASTNSSQTDIKITYNTGNTTWSIKANNINGPTTWSKKFVILKGSDLNGGDILFTPVGDNMRLSIDDIRLALVCPPSSNNYYVKTPANGGNNAGNGTSWATAFATVDRALEAVDFYRGFFPGDPVNIHVAAGTYTPDAVEDGFNLRAGVTIYGGYDAKPDVTGTLRAPSNTKDSGNRTIFRPKTDGRIISLTTTTPSKSVKFVGIHFDGTGFTQSDGNRHGSVINITANDNQVELDSCMIYGFSTTTPKFAVISMQNNCNVIIRNSIVRDNYTQQGVIGTHGGSTPLPTIKIYNSTFAYNRASSNAQSSGGLVGTNNWSDNITFEAYNSTFLYNRSTNKRAPLRTFALQNAGTISLYNTTVFDYVHMGWNGTLNISHSVVLGAGKTNGGTYNATNSYIPISTLPPNGNFDYNDKAFEIQAPNDSTAFKALFEGGLMLRSCDGFAPVLIPDETNIAALQLIINQNIALHTNAPKDQCGNTRVANATTIGAYEVPPCALPPKLNRTGGDASQSVSSGSIQTITYTLTNATGVSAVIGGGSPITSGSRTVNGVTMEITGTGVGTTITISGSPCNETDYFIVTTGQACLADFASGTITGGCICDPVLTGKEICESSSFDPLSVTTVGEGFSYQWYRNTNNNNTTGTAIAGATSATYTPLVTESGFTAGTNYYYYCVVTKDAATSANLVEGSLAWNGNDNNSRATCTGDCTVSSSTVVITGTGGDWEPQLLQRNSNLNNLTKGKTYRLTFTARSTVERHIQVGIQRDARNGGDWTYRNATTDQYFRLTDTDQTFEIEFVYNGGAEDNLLSINLGGMGEGRITENATVTFTNISFVELIDAYECGRTVPSGVHRMNTAPVLTRSETGGAASQTVCAEEAIANITYTYGGSATRVRFRFNEGDWNTTTQTVNGITITISGTTAVVSGTPTASVEYEIETTGQEESCAAATGSGTITLRNPATFTWTGVVDGNWGNSANWEVSGGGTTDLLTSKCDDIVISSTAAHYPTLTDTVYINNITFEPHASIGQIQYLKYNEAHVKMEFAPYRWYMISPVLKDKYPGDYAPDEVYSYVRYFSVDGSTGGWSNTIANPVLNLTPGMGFAFSTFYRKWTPGNITLSFPSDLAEHQGTPVERARAHRFIIEDEDKNFMNTITIDLNDNHGLAQGSVTGTPEERHVILGNPYMSHLDLSAFYAANSNKITSNIKVFDYILGSFPAFDCEMEESTHTSMTGLVAPHQAFFVELLDNKDVDAELEDGTIEFALNAGEMSTVCSTGTTKLRGSDISLNLLRMRASIDGTTSIDALVLAKEGASNEYISGEDGLKLFSSQSVIDIYTQLGENAIDINKVDIGDLSSLSIPVNIKTSKTGRLAIEINGASGFLSADNIYFMDMLTGDATSLFEQNIFEINKEATDDIINRFYLLFEQEEENPGTTEINENEEQGEKVLIGRIGGDVVVQSKGEQILSVTVYDVLGRKIVSANDLQTTYFRHPLPMKTFSYIVKVVTDKKTLTEKIFIK